MERIELMKKETFKKTAAALLVATTVSSGIFSVKTTEVKASISTQTALKNFKYHVNRVFKMASVVMRRLNQDASM